MHWLVVLAIVLVLFGAGKLPRMMGDFAKGIKAFKAGMKEGDEETAETPPAASAAARREYHGYCRAHRGFRIAAAGERHRAAPPARLAPIGRKNRGRECGAPGRYRGRAGHSAAGAQRPARNPP